MYKNIALRWCQEVTQRSENSKKQTKKTLPHMFMNGQLMARHMLAEPVTLCAGAWTV